MRWGNVYLVIQSLSIEAMLVVETPDLPRLIRQERLRLRGIHSRKGMGHTQDESRSGDGPMCRSL